ncbi:MAG: hypothetical protein ABW321_03135 [Polyangiales bacterium]
MDKKAIGTLLAAVLVALSAPVMTPSVAEAGFGRRGSATNSESRSDDRGRDRGRTQVRTGSSSADDRRSSSGWGRQSDRSWSGSRRYRRPWHGYSTWGYGLVLVPPPPPPVYPVQIDAGPSPDYGYGYDGDQEPVPPFTTALSGDFMLGRGGQLLGAQLAVEGERLGFRAGYSALFVPIAGTDQSDTLHLAQAQLTYAVLASQRARLRAELGVHLASAPEVTFVAPGAGLSAAVQLAGPLGIEARVFGNVWPYTQLDARAGVTLGAGRVGFSAGIRSLYLSDNGVLGAVNAGDTSDHAWGPYFLLAVVL